MHMCGRVVCVCVCVCVCVRERERERERTPEKKIDSSIASLSVHCNEYYQQPLIWDDGWHLLNSQIRMGESVFRLRCTKRRSLYQCRLRTALRWPPVPLSVSATQSLALTGGTPLT